MREAQTRIDSREFAEWRCYYELEPWGEERADLRAGIIASTVYNIGKGKGRMLSPADFMPKFDRRRQTQEEIGHRLMVFAQAHHGKTQNPADKVA